MRKSLLVVGLALAVFLIGPLRAPTPQTGAAKVDIITHSMGGQSSRYHLKYLGGPIREDVAEGLRASAVEAEAVGRGDVVAEAGACVAFAKACQGPIRQGFVLTPEGAASPFDFVSSSAILDTQKQPPHATALNIRWARKRPPPNFNHPNRPPPESQKKLFSQTTSQSKALALVLLPR